MINENPMTTEPALNAATAHSLRWLNADQTRLDAIVEWHQMPGEMPFTADDGDIELHVQRFMERARAGDFGPIAAYVEPVPVPAPVPLSISPLQARKALRQAGIKAAVDAYVASLGEEEQEEWEYAVEVRRDNATINNGWAILGRSQAELDDLFRLGATL